MEVVTIIRLSKKDTAVEIEITAIITVKEVTIVVIVVTTKAIETITGGNTAEETVIAKNTTIIRVTIAVKAEIFKTEVSKFISFYFLIDKISNGSIMAVCLRRTLQQLQSPRWWRWLCGGYQSHRNADRSDPAVRTNDRWQEPDKRDDSQQGNNQRTIPKGDNIDYTALGPRNERLETELFGVGELSGINFNKYEDIPVEATGNQVPPNINSFDDIKLTPIIQTNIQNARYDKPTPVQKYAIPIICSGRDLMACAQTGWYPINLHIYFP